MEALICILSPYSFIINFCFSLKYRINIRGREVVGTEKVVSFAFSGDEARENEVRRVLFRGGSLLQWFGHSQV